jgi:hypothetical protein
MKYSEIIGQLKQWLPFFTNYFSDTLTSTDAVNNAGTVTITFGGQTLPAGLNVGDTVAITDALQSVNVSNATQADGIITVGTETAHDYTSDIADQQIRITGTDYDETFVLSYVPNRFTLELIDDGQDLPPSDAIVNQANVTNFSGTRIITAIDEDAPSISYSVGAGMGNIVQSGIKAHFPTRISGCITPELMTNSYTAQSADDKLWLFVIMGNPTANKSRVNGNDAIDTLQSNQDFRQTIIFNFSVFVVVPSKGATRLDTSGMAERDLIEDIRKPIFQSLLGWNPATDLTSYGTNTIVYAGEAAFDFPNNAYYIHRFNFQWNADLTAPDTYLSIDTTRAFRDIFLTQELPNSDTIIETYIDLDDFPVGQLGNGFGGAFGAAFGAS